LLRLNLGDRLKRIPGAFVGHELNTAREKKADYRDTPAYSPAEAARYLRLPPATLRAWALGREYPTAEGSGKFKPLIRPASRRPPMLSFSNLIEAHVLRSLRVEHKVSVKAVRRALDYAEQKLGIERLLLREELRAEAGRVFLDRYGELIELSASGQLAMRKLLEEHLKRVEWDETRFPIRLYPIVSGIEQSQVRLIAIDPRISFGRPVVATKSISTAAIAERIDAGETVEDLASDYDLVPEEIEEAVLYEHAAHCSRPR
jgi:uncharacterized protein (DUF433 family)